ncbi:hypothetical protein TraAM80_03877 [Trypanosoma rangeli]|uniref:Uncharacterized protein n=1 Tax=Trypanosoma rangeli TaxID=5698 RepID=A0A3R7NR23_TRYRA|nr:uncharacterized protein TraAM80_03877 [Trypanosoma rangeli]RNF06411.1 hypothetical protein TraAM80_03877 [Trypanosoma rangeli]|eukprot:RNF06411.1 hypothetical protein TraAM80_03877 [Trypanosoma rangeli]
MSLFQWKVGENYVDVLSSCPFTIQSCQSADFLNLGMPQQSFPLHARRQWYVAGKYIATLWALDTGRSYLVNVVVSNEDASVPGADSVDCNGSGSSVAAALESTVLVKLPQNNGPLALCSAHAILDVRLLYRDDFLNCVLSQSGDFMFVEQSGMAKPTLLHLLFYHSLFALPYEVNGKPIYLLPNGATGRFCLDLTQENVAWRGSRKVRRLMSCDRFVVAVNRDIRDSLCLAREYHIKQKGSTWIGVSYIDLLVNMASHPAYGVRIMALELLEKNSGMVLAGCLGYSLGSVYHDFTMFTMERGPEGFGNFATKLLGEALQQCGYNFWYWGMRLAYMEQFEGKYGGKVVCKSEFITRWGQYRNIQPTCTLEAFFQSGRGMLPYFVPVE